MSLKLVCNEHSYPEKTLSSIFVSLMSVWKSSWPHIFTFFLLHEFVEVELKIVKKQYITDSQISRKEVSEDIQK